jgi:hypothetical protein
MNPSCACSPGATRCSGAPARVLTSNGKAVINRRLQCLEIGFFQIVDRQRVSLGELSGVPSLPSLPLSASSVRDSGRRHDITLCSAGHCRQAETSHTKARRCKGGAVGNVLNGCLPFLRAIVPSCEPPDHLSGASRTETSSVLLLPRELLGVPSLPSLPLSASSASGLRSAAEYHALFRWTLSTGGDISHKGTKVQRRCSRKRAQWLPAFSSCLSAFV